MRFLIRVSLARFLKGHLSWQSYGSMVQFPKTLISPPNKIRWRGLKKTKWWPGYNGWKSALYLQVIHKIPTIYGYFRLHKNLINPFKSKYFIYFSMIWQWEPKVEFVYNVLSFVRNCMYISIFIHPMYSFHLVCLLIGAALHVDQVPRPWKPKGPVHMGSRDPNPTHGIESQHGGKFPTFESQ